MSPSDALPEPTNAMSSKFYTPDDATTYHTPRRPQPVQYGSTRSTYPNSADADEGNATQLIQRQPEEAQVRERKRTRTHSARSRSQSRSRRRRSGSRSGYHSDEAGRRSRSYSPVRTARDERHVTPEPGPSVPGPKSKAQPASRRVYDDNLDELNEQVSRDRIEIKSLQQEISRLKPVAARVDGMEKKIVALEADVKGLLAFQSILATNIKSNSANFPPLRSLLDGANVPAATDSQAGTSYQAPKSKAVSGARALYSPHLWRQIIDHGRDTIYRLMRIQKATEVKAPVLKADGTYEWWVIGNDKVKELRVAFGPKLGPNADPSSGWIEEFATELQDEKHMKANKEFLRTVPPEHFIEAFESATFKSLTQAWKDKQNGSLEEKTASGLVRGREYHRSDAKATLREGLRKDTELADPKFNFLCNRHYQSPEHSDAEDSTRKCIDEAAYRAPEVNQAMDALRLRHRAMGKKISPATRPNNVFFKNDLPVPALGEGKKLPAWSVNKSWKEEHPDAYKASQFLIDTEDTSVPDELTAFLKKYPAPARTYVPVRPTPAKATSGALGDHKPQTPRFETPSAPFATPGPKPKIVTHPEIDPLLQQVPDSQGPTIQHATQVSTTSSSSQAEASGGNSNSYSYPDLHGAYLAYQSLSSHASHLVHNYSPFQAQSSTGQAPHLLVEQPLGPLRLTHPTQVLYPPQHNPLSQPFAQSVAPPSLPATAVHSYELEHRNIHPSVVQPHRPPTPGGLTGHHVGMRLEPATEPFAEIPRIAEQMEVASQQARQQQGLPDPPPVPPQAASPIATTHIAACDLLRNPQAVLERESTRLSPRPCQVAPSIPANLSTAENSSVEAAPQAIETQMTPTQPVQLTSSAVSLAPHNDTTAVTEAEVEPSASGSGSHEDIGPEHESGQTNGGGRGGRGGRRGRGWRGGQGGRGGLGARGGKAKSGAQVPTRTSQRTRASKK